VAAIWICNGSLGRETYNRVFCILGCKSTKKEGEKQKTKSFSLLAFLFLLLLGLEAIFAYTTDGANPIIGDILKCCSWSDSAIGIAFCWVINITANFTYVLHNSFCFFNY
jgi:hypothetical protein